MARSNTRHAEIVTPRRPSCGYHEGLEGARESRAPPHPRDPHRPRSDATIAAAIVSEALKISDLHKLTVETEPWKSLIEKNSSASEENQHTCHDRSGRG
jgi:hypothetical protein